jgi:transcription initiation factor TFIIB
VVSLSSEKDTKGYSKESKYAVGPEKVKYCPECNSNDLVRDYDLGQEVCGHCGLVLREGIIDRDPEWRAFDNEQRAKRTRVGAPLTYTIHDKGLSTMIDWHDKDIYGKSLSSGQKAQFYRLRKWQRRTRVADAVERNMSISLGEIAKVSEDLNLPENALETVSVIYRKAVKEGFVKGRSMKGVQGACIYLGCRQCGVSRTLEEIAEKIEIPGKNKKEVKKEIGRTFMRMIPELNLFGQTNLIEKSKLVSKYSNELTNQGKVEEIANKILVAAKQKKLTSGRSPVGITAAATYIASVLTGDKKTQREMAKDAKVTEVTIRSRYKDLVKNLDIRITLIFSLLVLQL